MDLQPVDGRLNVAQSARVLRARLGFVSGINGSVLFARLDDRSPPQEP